MFLMTIGRPYTREVGKDEMLEEGNLDWLFLKQMLPSSHYYWLCLLMLRTHRNIYVSFLHSYKEPCRPIDEKVIFQAS